MCRFSKFAVDMSCIKSLSQLLSETLALIAAFQVRALWNHSFRQLLKPHSRKLQRYVAYRVKQSFIFFLFFTFLLYSCSHVGFLLVPFGPVVGVLFLGRGSKVQIPFHFSVCDFKLRHVPMEGHRNIPEYSQSPSNVNSFVFSLCN